MFRKLFCCFPLAILLFIFAGGVASAQNTVVMLDPLRLVFTDGKNSAHLNITNTSQEKRQYKIMTYPLRMHNDGVLRRPDRVTKREAITKKMVHFSPRIATIPAGQIQVVRVAVRRPPGLPDGDYFTYLKVSPVPLKSSDSEGKGSVALSMNIGVSIPVIVTVGTPDATVALTSVQRVKGNKGSDSFLMKLNRDGKFSSYNSIAVYGMVDGKEKLIAYNRRVVTYVPVKERIVKVRIHERGFAGGPIRVVLNELEGKEEKILKSYDLKI